jgi:hypothetical protein
MAPLCLIDLQFTANLSLLLEKTSPMEQQEQKQFSFNLSLMMEFQPEVTELTFSNLNLKF